MKILGIVKASLIDFPGKASTVLFIGGCNFKCGYCHNPDIVHGKGDALDPEEILDFLARRRKFLDGVVISGGEPTIHEELSELIKKIKALGYAIKLDTNGTRPQTIKSLIDDKLIDYIAMDLKAPLEKYAAVAGISETGLDVAPLIEESIGIIKNSGLEHEFRTTVCREQLSREDIARMGELISGAPKYCLQRFRGTNPVLGSPDAYTAYPEEEMEALRTIAAAYANQAVVR